MKKFEEIQRGKMTTAYGGIGSMIETKDNGSLMILPIDHWKVYNSHIHPELSEDGRRMLIDEPRLIHRLKTIGFENVQGLFVPPVIENAKPWLFGRHERNKTIQSKYFPEWYYCPYCREFHPLRDWETLWTLDDRFNDNEPSCYKCSRRYGNGIRRTKLEQIRYVLISMDGEIADVPWNDIIARRYSEFTAPIVGSNERAYVWDFDSYRNEHPVVHQDVGPNATEHDRAIAAILQPKISYNTSKSTDNLYGLSIKQSTTENKVTLAEIERHYIIYNGHVFRMVVRNGNNVFFPYVLNSIYIPRVILSDEKITEIKNNYNGECDYLRNLMGTEPNNDQINKIIERVASNMRYPIDIVKQLVENDFDGNIFRVDYSSEEYFRNDEFKYIVDENNYDERNVNSTDDQFTAVRYVNENLPRFIKGLYAIKKLKETKIQVAYSRVDKVSVNDLPRWEGNSMEGNKFWYDNDRGEVNNLVPVKLKPTTEKNINQIRYMPAVESYGEGIFVELDMPNDIDGSARKTFLHTYCHLIMKELEFECGYPLASLSERLYYLPADVLPENDNEQDRFGFMIYSICGEDGSFGGLTSLFNVVEDRMKIVKIIENAIRRAIDCPNDPICSSDKGHCFACLDLPETSCEEFNTCLNRNIFNSEFIV